MVEKLIYCGCDPMLAKNINDLCVRNCAEDEAIRRIIQCCSSGQVCIEDFRTIVELAPGVFKNYHTVREHLYSKANFHEVMRQLEQAFGTGYTKITGDEFKSVMENLAQHATPKIDKRPYFRRFEKRKF